MLYARPRTTSAGATNAATTASAMSSACANGRHGVPSESTFTVFDSSAWPTRLFSTMSARSRGENPNAVALRIDTGTKSASASSTRSSSTRTLDSAYGVTGRSGASSSTSSLPDWAPYTEQVDA
jgi:hypothetical protein